MPSVSHDELLKALNYEPDNGSFTWRIGYGRRGGIDIAGNVQKSGYRYIGIKGRRYLAHRLAWFYVTGKWPDGEIDHVNCDESDNRFANLRIATRSQNASNRGINIDNRTGFKGVRFVKRSSRYQARIVKDGVERSLGCFDCPAAAHFIYTVAADNIFGAFARGN